MENQPVMLGNQDVGTAAATAPCEQAPILVKEPQTSGKAKQGNLVSNQDTCGIASNGAVPAKSKVKTCLPADCTFGRITVTLDNNTMWNKFYHRNTEMILTKQGRRMFPYCRYWITGLESSLKYILVMDISPVDNFHYKWNGHSWEPSEKAEPHVWGRVFIHPESPSTGHYWMHQPVSFYKLKLTNNTLDQEGHIILHSMHRYLPRLHLVPAEKGTDIIQLNSSDVHTFTFPQTEFFAVTAYQNIQITQLKIDCNPFAKGFVKGGLKSSDQYKAKQNGRSEHEGFPHNDRCTYSPDADVLDPGQRGLNSSYDNQKMCNTDLERKPFNSCINEHDGPELKQETTELNADYYGERLQGPRKRGRPRKLKLSEVTQPLKAILKNHCAPLSPYSDHPEFMLDLEDVGGFLFVSSGSKEGLSNHTVDKSGRTEEPQNEQAALQITCDSGCQERLSLLETRLLEDLKSFRHKQVVHPSLQEVGLKLGSVDPTDSIDLQYLGVLLPLSSSKDRAFGNNQGIRPSSLDTGPSFISRTGKTDDFRKIKGWQEKLHNASRLEGSILESSLKNQSAFYSDKLDEYLESEGKRMNTSMGFSASISSYPVPHQFSSESSNYIKTQHSILKKKCTPLASYCFKPFSLPSFRKGRRNITSKQASTRGSIRSNNSAVPSPVLSKEQHRFQVLKNKVTNPQPDSKMDNIGTVLMMPNLDENVQGKQRTVCQSMQNSHICNPSTKLIKLEGCALQNGKPRTYITEEHADFSLPLLNNCKVIGRQTAQCSSSSCQPGCVCASSPLEEFQPTLCSETECTFECLKKKMILTKGISIQKPLHGILTCCNGQEEEWKLEQTNKGETTCDDFYKADLKQSSINFPVWVKEEETDTKPIDIPTSSKSTKHVMLPHSEVILPFSKLNPTCEVVKVEQGKTPNFKSMFPEQKNVVSSIIQPTASLVREVGAVHLEERKSHIQGTHTTSMELEVTASNSKAEELLVTQPKSQGTMYEKNAITSGIAGKNTEMMEQLSSFDPVFQLETVLADHSYFLKDTAETQQHVKLSEGTLDDISQSVHSKSELSNNQPVDAARAVTRDRSKHTEDERCRRKEMKGLFEKLQVTLQSQSYPRVANRVLLENAFEEIRGLTNQADQLMEQKKLLMCKQDILIRKASALSGKTQEIVLKKLQYTNAKQKSGEAQKMHQQQKNQPMKAIEISETARPYVQDGPNTNALVQGHPANEDSFLMPRIVNVMSFATEEDSDLNLEINRDSYVSLVTDSQAWKPSFPVVSEEINVHYVKKPDSSGEKEKDATGTIKHFIGKKEISFSQMVEVSSLKGSSESLVTKLGIEELTQSQAKEKQTDKGGGGEGRQWSQYSSFQALQVKGRKTLGTEIELQKVASAIQEAAPDASDLVAMEENDETDGILTSLLNEIVFLNHQLNDDASDVAKLPNSLSSCLSLGVTENQRESSTANGSSFQFDALRGSLKNLCLVQESCGCITPLMLHLESDGIADCDRTLRQPPSKPDVLKLMLGSEVKDPDLDFLIVNTDGSVKHMAPLSKTTHMSLPVLKMKTNLESGKVDTVWKPMPKLAPFGLKPASFPLDSVGQITKVMSLLAPVTAEMSSVGLEATQSVTSQEQD
ncbi:MAX gene-associated protein-like isoform X2 [Sphaerodactylus townsendi]|uniref:MAX gene-associated protein-like isoform X2 n=1 Tax=Sphaerodactylus townsendi TaxID=933632 RepID=UPI002026A616|nr:MAX gene-associated protein-like isoform X2 [Sphaerodactylus townsendi]